jgi:hypothetical protein
VHPERSCRWTNATVPREGELQLQSALLMLLLGEYPIQLTEEEIVAALANAPMDFGERDAIARAVRDLSAVGLTRRHGPFVLPTLTAFRSYELWEA